MARGKRLVPPRIVLIPSETPKYDSQAQAWAVVGPVLARILGKVLQASGLFGHKNRRRPRPSDMDEST